MSAGIPGYIAKKDVTSTHLLVRNYHEVSKKLQKIEGGPTLNLSALNVVTDILWTSSINLATNAECSSENLLNRTLQLLRKRLKSHRSRNFNDLVERDGLAVLDIFLLLSIAGRLLQGLDNEG